MVDNRKDKVLMFVEFLICVGIIIGGGIFIFEGIGWFVGVLRYYD